MIINQICFKLVKEALEEETETEENESEEVTEES